MIYSPAPKAEVKPKLRLANENPWYLLATLHGEQPEGANGTKFDAALQFKNRKSWNEFMTSRHGSSLNFEKAFRTDEGEKYRKDALGYDSGMLQKLYTDRVRSVLQTQGEHALPTGNIDFSNTQFDRPLLFQGYNFLGERIDFQGSEISWLAATDAAFSGYAVFDNLTIPSQADFQNVVFLRGASFCHVTFDREALFSNVKFCELANFSGAIFSENAKFDRIAFTGIAEFKNARFKGLAYFGRTAFERRVFFDSSTFKGKAIFNNMTFNGYAHFNNVTFSSDAVFMNTKFLARTIFEDTKFITSPPDFRGASLHEGTEWHGVVWPKIPSQKKPAQDHISCYERIKAEMERLKKHEDEHFFFIKETQCREKRDAFPKNLPSTLYNLFSGYGASLAQPLNGLAASILLGLLPIWFHFGPFKLKKALGLSTANTFALLGIRKEFIVDEVVKSLPASLKILAVVQSAFGALFLFLLGLALRNRFRMK